MILIEVGNALDFLEVCADGKYFRIGRNVCQQGGLICQPDSWFLAGGCRNVKVNPLASQHHLDQTCIY